MSELEATVNYLSRCLERHRKAVFFVVSAGLLIWLMIAVKEITTLLLASYGIALLLDPVLTRLQRFNISRGLGVILIGGIFLLIVLLLLILAIPPLIYQYHELLRELPDYIHTVLTKIDGLMQSWFGISLAEDSETLVANAKEFASSVGIEQLKAGALAVGQTMLRGYSFTLTLLNLFLLPFFVFYLARDLHQLHELLGSFLRPDIRTRISTVGQRILEHVYAFFEGQLTVATLLAVLYVVGLWLVGLPSALVVGCISGFLNVVPYLGIATGIVLATVITLVSDPSLTQLLLVWGVFAAVQVLEGNFLTPKIVGESVGIHPLGVMVALIIGGQLFGLIGLILAIPAAAAIRVLYSYLQSLLNELEDRDISDAFGPRSEN